MTKTNNLMLNRNLKKKEKKTKKDKKDITK